MPEAQLDGYLQWAPLSSGHTGSQRWNEFFGELFYSRQTLCELGSRLQSIVDSVISWGIWASQKLSGGTLQDLIELQHPKILGYLLIFGSYFKPIAYF